MFVILYLKDCTKRVYIGSETKSTKVLTQLEEDKLQESGVLNLNTPIGLLRSVFFSTMERTFVFVQVKRLQLIWISC